MKIHENLFYKIISLENLFESWKEFSRGKRSKLDVQIFEKNLENNIFNLAKELISKTYKHSNYTSFYITDPKLRHIHKASVKDRIVHHAVYKILYEIFDPSFIYDSYSCRLNKGTHKAVLRLEKFTRRESKNYTSPCFALKCDIRKFFANVDHNILLKLIQRRIKDEDTIWLLEEIIESFSVNQSKGIPLGNLTSQLFANIYLNKLDQFVKHKLRIKYYARYTDDFMILSKSKEYLKSLINLIDNFLKETLLINLHPNKLQIIKLRQGIDFLGYVVLPHYRNIRTKTKNRMIRKLEKLNWEYMNHKISKQRLNQSLQSYLGCLSHSNSFGLSQEFKERFSKNNLDKIENN